MSEKWRVVSLSCQMDSCGTCFGEDRLQVNAQTVDVVCIHECHNPQTKNGPVPRPVPVRKQVS